MRCFTREVRGNWHAAFDWAGVSYTHSLRTKDEREAEVRIGPIRDTLYRLENGTLMMPPDADPKAYIVSGGNQSARPSRVPGLTVGALADKYLDAVQRIEENTKKTKSIHLDHVRRVFGADATLESIRQADVQGYATSRRKQKHHGRRISGYTIKKELRTFRQVWSWAAAQGHAAAGPSWSVEAVELPKDRGREPFRSFDQIARIIARGGVSEEDEARHWECLYLDGQEVSALLDYVRENASSPFILPMIAFVALTGCRRSEMARSLVDDWDLERGRVHIREKKRSTDVDFTTREVDVHALLGEIMADWFARHPGGRNAITQDGKPLAVNQATDHFKRTLRGHEKWSKIPGFHTLRHSVASILASRGTDQRYIDKIIGHQTEAMRKRYQHLFPKGARDAIDGLL